MWAGELSWFKRFRSCLTNFFMYPFLHFHIVSLTHYIHSWYKLSIVLRHAQLTVINCGNKTTLVNYNIAVRCQYNTLSEAIRQFSTVLPQQVHCTAASLQNLYCQTLHNITGMLQTVTSSPTPTNIYAFVERSFLLLCKGIYQNLPKHPPNEIEEELNENSLAWGEIGVTWEAVLTLPLIF